MVAADEREQPFLHAHDEDHRELEPLGAVDGHEGDGIHALLEHVGAGEKSDILQEPAHARLFRPLLVLLGGAEELSDVIESAPRLDGALLLQGQLISGLLYHRFGEFGQGGGLHGQAEVVDQADELADGAVGARAEFGDGLGVAGGVEDGHVPLERRLLQALHGLVSDAAGGALIMRFRLTESAGFWSTRR